jgi:hypothetical protein
VQTVHAEHQRAVLVFLPPVCRQGVGCQGQFELISTTKHDFETHSLCTSLFLNQAAFCNDKYLVIVSTGKGDFDGNLAEVYFLEKYCIS